ncbi:N-acylethanolamine-hydrolyzing acid amidase [Amia ocellicauda]|uniref:N-acylethanolamine-hydrolyzing acid amidase n=1 Tax=Amia ocellicauda TaxID=2972642 RepID=UPI003463BE22
MCPVLLVLLGFSGICTGDFSPPQFNISLDLPPEERWLSIADHYDKDYLKKYAEAIIEKFIPKWVHKAISPVVESLENYMPQPYAGEMRGASKGFGCSLADVIVLNLAYEITAFCTSIVAQDINGNLYHARNMDYPFPAILRNMTMDILYVRNGQVAYRGTTFAGYVGIWTGQSPGKFTISGDERSQGFWWENAVAAFLMKNTPASWLMRNTLEEAEDFQEAVLRLSKVPLISDVYYIVAGVNPGEGVVVTRNRRGAADIWPLNPLNGEWYRVETNYDHWTTPPPDDDRRTPAIKALNAIGQKNITLDTLYKVISVHPTCNRITIYTTVMTAAFPEKYRTVVREET